MVCKEFIWGQTTLQPCEIMVAKILHICPQFVIELTPEVLYTVGNDDKDSKLDIVENMCTNMPGS